jgi:hypothetical protein
MKRDQALVLWSDLLCGLGRWGAWLNPSEDKLVSGVASRADNESAPTPHTKLLKTGRVRLLVLLKPVLWLLVCLLHSV